MKKLTNMTAIAALFGMVMALSAVTAQAIEGKEVKCRVTTSDVDPRVQIAVKFRDVPAGGTLMVLLASPGAPIIMQSVDGPEVAGDLEFEFDSDVGRGEIGIDEPEGQRFDISDTFAAVGETVTATLSGVTADTGDKGCEQK